MPETETRFYRVRDALLEAGAQRLWEATTEHDTPQRIIAYTGPGGVVLVHDYVAGPRGEDRGVEIYTNGCEQTLPATIEFALEWLGLDAKDDSGPGPEPDMPTATCKSCGEVVGTDPHDCPGIGRPVA